MNTRSLRHPFVFDSAFFAALESVRLPERCVHGLSTVHE